MPLVDRLNSDPLIPQTSTSVNLFSVWRRRDRGVDRAPTSERAVAVRSRKLGGARSRVAFGPRDPWRANNPWLVSACTGDVDLRTRRRGSGRVRAEANFPAREAEAHERGRDRVHSCARLKPSASRSSPRGQSEEAFARSCLRLRMQNRRRRLVALHQQIPTRRLCDRTAVHEHAHDLRAELEWVAIHTTRLASRPGCSVPTLPATPRISAGVSVTARSASSHRSHARRCPHSCLRFRTLNDSPPADSATWTPLGAAAPRSPGGTRGSRSCPEYCSNEPTITRDLCRGDPRGDTPAFFPRAPPARASA